MSEFKSEFKYSEVLAEYRRQNAPRPGLLGRLRAFVTGLLVPIAWRLWGRRRTLARQRFLATVTNARGSTVPGPEKVGVLDLSVDAQTFFDEPRLVDTASGRPARAMKHITN